MSEEDDDEDEEEGKTAVPADEKNKNIKPGLHGVFLLSPLPLLRPSVSHLHLRRLADVVVSRRTDRERIPVRYCTLGTRDAAKYVPPCVRHVVRDLGVTL